MKPRVINERSSQPEVEGVKTTREGLLKPIDPVSPRESVTEKKHMRYLAIGVYIVLVALGVGTGFTLAKAQSGKAPTSAPGVVQTDNAVGSTDQQTFKDSASGSVEKGGIDGEGTHKLIRDGGPSQTAYLISSVIDLDQYVGKKVTVWGQTVAAKKAAWLMDVGKIQAQ